MTFVIVSNGERVYATACVGEMFDRLQKRYRIEAGTEWTVTYCKGKNLRDMWNKFDYHFGGVPGGKYTF